MTSRKLISVAIPIRNELANLPSVESRLTSVLDRLVDYDFEIILIDNGSDDGSADYCEGWVARHPIASYVGFTRNFGIEASFQAGISYARGDALIFLFSDLQDPPELIPNFVEKWESGHDVVYGKLLRRMDHTVIKSIGAAIAYRVIYLLSEIKIPINATDFRLISRRVMDTLNNCGESSRFMRGLVHWTGYKSCGVPYRRDPRLHGKTSAGLLWSIGYALNAVFSFSDKPIKIASGVGLLSFLMSIFGGVFWIIITVLSRSGYIDITPPPVGWTTMALLIFFFGGIQCLFIGILGEYVAKILSEVKGRPNWVVRKSIKIGLESE